MIGVTPLFRLWARRRLRRLSAMNPADVQQAELLRLVRTAQDTRFGRAHGFGRIRSVADFQAAVPVRDYDAFRDDIWGDAFPHLADIGWPGPVDRFALTSGTTRDVTKYIPVTAAMIRSNKRAALDTMVHHLAARPDSRAPGGRSFILGGSTDLKPLALGILAGDLSGIAAAAVPAWAQPLVWPPRALALEADWERKIELLARGSLDLDIRSISGTPSWLLLLFERLAGLRPDAGRDLTRIWPNLELLVHGGVRFDPYKPQFDSWLRGRPVDYREAYAASEGFIASSDRGFGEGLRLHLDTGLFYEFVPMEDLAAAQPVRHWAGTVETGVDYAILLSTCAGLWSWLLGDTVRFVACDPPRLLVTGRTGYTMSAFGEHLTGEEIDRAVSWAAAEAGLAVSDYAMGAVFPTAGQPLGGHRYVVEFAGGLPEAPALDRFAGALDRDLAAGNEDYAAHRAGGFGLRAPDILAVPPGFFAGWMKRRGKLGGQHKVPRIIGDSALFGGLLRAGADAAGGEGS
ncbi:MAG: GH3 auxin-responsive promoter family protein [Rhodospirillaceae bacterium]|nr:GH3 auxin-responsive promoter family protein [Rhodospirillaceae bacterium]MYB11756.1 GH3 auxin-responsive promoter family protein [Rhodospirillaceae bacterium]MYI48971.1 GH3 auxin-responsive promoter family protein [Rhodospirillaceae bacterium]